MPSSGREFDSPPPLSLFRLTSRISGEERGLQNRGPGFDSRSALPERSCSCPRRPAEGRPSSKRLVAGSTPAEGSRVHCSILPCPHLARWPRQPDSHSGNAGSNPAGDAGLICRPVCFFGGPRLGGRACQRSITSPAPRRTARRRSRAAARSASLFSLSRRPGIGLRTRLARFDSSQRGQIRSSFREVGEADRNEHQEPRSHARLPAPVLVARDTSFRSLLPRFDSWQGRRRKGRSHPRLIISALQVQFLLLHPRRLEASGGSHKAVRGGSIPPVATKKPSRSCGLLDSSGCGSIWQSSGSGHRRLEVRILSPRPFRQYKFIWVWLNLVRAPVRGTGDWRFESSHPDRAGRASW